MAAGRLHGAADRAEHAPAVLDWHADLRFTVFNSATGQKLGENLTAANPKSATLSLQAGVALRQWLVDGGTTFRNGYGRPRAAARPGPA